MVIWYPAANQPVRRLSRPSLVGERRGLRTPRGVDLGGPVGALTRSPRVLLPNRSRSGPDELFLMSWWSYGARASFCICHMSYRLSRPEGARPSATGQHSLRPVTNRTAGSLQLGVTNCNLFLILVRLSTCCLLFCVKVQILMSNSISLSHRMTTEKLLPSFFRSGQGPGHQRSSKIKFCIFRHFSTNRRITRKTKELQRPKKTHSMALLTLFPKSVHRFDLRSMVLPPESRLKIAILRKNVSR